VVRGPVGAAGGVDCVTMLSAGVFAVAVAVALAVSVMPRHVLLLEGAMLLLGHVALFAIAVAFAFEATCSGVERLGVHWEAGKRRPRWRC
jgi:hypothetical protein